MVDSGSLGAKVRPVPYGYASLVPRLSTGEGLGTTDTYLSFFKSVCSPRVFTGRLKFDWPIVSVCLLFMAGYIGKLKLQIPPVRHIKSQPWVVQIDQLYVVIGPPWTEDVS